MNKVDMVSKVYLEEFCRLVREKESGSCTLNFLFKQDAFFQEIPEGIDHITLGEYKGSFWKNRIGHDDSDIFLHIQHSI